METCGILTDDYDIVGLHRIVHWEWCECLRPRGHAGPHLILREDGKYVAHEMDLFCTCEMCKTSDDPKDWCRVHREVTPAEVELLMGTTEEGVVLITLKG